MVGGEYMTKTCKQCGVIKPIEQFRNYYGGRTGTYTMCRSCEKINSRVKYLENKANLCDKESEELEAIFRLWETQRALGYQPPRTTPKGQKPVVETVLEMIDTYKSRAEALVDITGDTLDAPPELLKWLTVDLTEDPDYYLDDIYDGLRASYKPVLRIDETAMMPVYDESFADILDKILERFYRYEEDYYAQDN